jgi:phosphopantothenoylcysteine decarboxylase/phosphopantothenate--cysteine ligase
MSGLKGKTIVLGITGGIAAYKAAEVCRLLVKAGATVRVVMTAAAARFITPLTMQTLSAGPVALDLFDTDEEARIGHIRLGDEADLIVVAPATADAIARFAAGSAGDLLAAIILASRAPVVLAPAMNVNMWKNPITQQNLGRLLGFSRFTAVGPDAGDLACGWVGEGRLIEPAEIVAAVARVLAPQDLAGRRIVVTAGPTFEPIDDVRFLGNRSSGKMGFAIAEAAARRGATVTLIAGPVALAMPPGGGISRKNVETAAEMRAALLATLPQADVVVMAAAVADFRPAARVAGKLSRRALAGVGSPASARDAASALLSLSLTANPDILAEVSRERRGGRPWVVGFSAEIAADARDLVARAAKKLSEKNCDVMIANDVGTAAIGFDSDDNAVTLVFSDGTSESLARAPKPEIAELIWDRLVHRLPHDARPVPGARAGEPRPPRRGTGVRPAVRQASATRGRRA